MSIRRNFIPYLKHSITLNDVRQAGQYISAQQMAKVLTKQSAFQHMRVYEDCFYVYNPSLGVYEYWRAVELRVIISAILSTFEVMAFESPDYLQRIVESLRVAWAHGCLGSSERMDEQYIVFRDGVFDRETEQLLPYSPAYFTTIRFDWVYDAAQVARWNRPAKAENDPTND